MLNYLYHFDKTTISGKEHAPEIASMALDLLHGTENFVIPHMPGERLQVGSRILIKVFNSLQCGSKNLHHF